MLQATLRPKTAIVSKTNIFNFFHTKTQVTKFDLGVKSAKVDQGHNLKNLGSTFRHNAANQVSRSFLRRRPFNIFISLKYMGVAAMLVM